MGIFISVAIIGFIGILVYLNYLATKGKESFRVDEDGLKQGLKKVYYKSGNLNISVNYVDNLKQGEEIKYYESGEIEFKSSFVDNIRQGEMKQYYKTGVLLSTLNYVDGLKQGETISYYESGKIEFKSSYVDDIKQGEIISYKESGEIEYKTNIIDGVIQYENTIQGEDEESLIILTELEKELHEIVIKDDLYALLKFLNNNIITIVIKCEEDYRGSYQTENNKSSGYIINDYKYNDDDLLNSVTWGDFNPTKKVFRRGYSRKASFEISQELFIEKLSCYLNEKDNVGFGEWEFFQDWFKEWLEYHYGNCLDDVLVSKELIKNLIDDKTIDEDENIITFDDYELFDGMMVEIFFNRLSTQMLKVKAKIKVKEELKITHLRVNADDISKVDGNKGFYKGKLFTGIGFTLNEEGNVDMEVEFDDNGSMIETRMFHKNGQISSIIISNNDKWGGVINVELKKFDEFGKIITN